MKVKQILDERSLQKKPVILKDKRFERKVVSKMIILNFISKMGIFEKVESV